MDCELIGNSELFRNIDISEISELLRKLHAFKREYGRGEYIFREGSYIKNAAILLRGKVCIEKNDLWGTKTMISFVNPGELFGEMYALTENEMMMVDAVAVEQSEIIFLDLSNAGTIGNGIFVTNLMHDIAERTLQLTRKIMHTSYKTIRGRVSSYLSYMSKKTGARCFTIPFSRQQMADYLGVDRTALSAELGKMRDEGLISFYKNSFKILLEDEGL